MKFLNEIGLQHLISKLLPKKNGVLENYSEKLVDMGSSSNIDLSVGSVFKKTLTANTTFSITNPKTGVAHPFSLEVTQPLTARTITFPSSVKWNKGEIPDMTTASKTYILTFVTTDGGVTYRGMFGGEF